MSANVRSSRRGMGTTILALIMLFAAMMFYVWSRYHATKLGYALTELTSEERKLLEEQRSLTLELNRLSSLERVETLARKQLGLSEPRTDQVVYVHLQ